jgi:hypothetical protein
MPHFMASMFANKAAKMGAREFVFLLGKDPRYCLFQNFTNKGRLSQKRQKPPATYQQCDVAFGVDV